MDADGAAVVLARERHMQVRVERAGREVNAAIRWRVVLLTVENAPPMYSLLFLTSMSWTPAPLLILPANVIRWPVAMLSLTRRRFVWPFTVVKEPPTKTEVPEPSVARESTSPSSMGAKFVLIAPVVASNAKRFVRARIGPPGSLTCVNVPPATIWFPTGTIAFTMPSSTCGVQLAGLADTTVGLCRVRRDGRGGGRSPATASDSVRKVLEERRIGGLHWLSGVSPG